MMAKISGTQIWVWHVQIQPSPSKSRGDGLDSGSLCGGLQSCGIMGKAWLDVNPGAWARSIVPWLDRGGGGKIGKC